MVERQDIDALLISALYGELTPAQESQLTAHLESHPTDRSALEGLTRTRAAVHESRILAVQLDPPQSISALLIQEASRRAPKVAPDGEGWFQRFMRSFMQHPAMAAAAMLVVVVGIAALVSRGGTSNFAETESVDQSVATTTATSATATSAPAAAPAPELVGGAGSAAPGEAPVAANEAKNVDAYQVHLAEGAAKPQLALEQGKQVRAKAGEQQRALLEDGLVIRKEAAAPKDLDTAAAPRKPAAMQDKADSRSDSRSADDESGAPSNAPGDAYGYKGAAPVASSAGAGYATPAGSGRQGAAAPVTPPAPPPPPPTTTKAAPKSTTIARDEPSKDAKKSEADAGDPNLAWAREQHGALIAAVKQNNCSRAAQLALAIENRAPSYYASSVASDRSIKECVAQINIERDKNAELRAQRERAKRVNAEPSAPKRAVEAKPEAK